MNDNNLNNDNMKTSTNNNVFSFDTPQYSTESNNEQINNNVSTNNSIFSFDAPQYSTENDNDQIVSIVNENNINESMNNNTTNFSNILTNNNSSDNTNPPLINNELNTLQDVNVNESSIDSNNSSNTNNDNIEKLLVKNDIDNTALQQDNLDKPINNIAKNSNQIDDEELLKTFIGKNYDKILTNPFNFAGFFFTTFYLFYRKMFLYGIVLFLINLIISIIISNIFVTLLIAIIFGAIVNKIYLNYSKKKIAKIKLKNSGKNIEELTMICSNKGGTSIGLIFLGFITEIIIAIVTLIIFVIIGLGIYFGNSYNFNDMIKDIVDKSSNIEGTLLEDMSIDNYICNGSVCSIYIEEENNQVEYIYDADNVELFKTLGNYSKYIKVNIYYTQENNKKIITNYKIFLRTNNEDISSIINEDELRDKIGLYNIGTHSDTFTLTKIGSIGFGYKNDTAYTYINYTLVNNKNDEYKMTYIISNGVPKLTEGNKYNVTFEAVKGSLGYEFNIISIT